VSLPDETLSALRFDDRGLVPAIAQDALTGEIRMVAYMNRDAFEQTVTSREATFFSRSRNKLWKKGESSGNTLAVRAIHLDCDGDCVVLLVEPAGPSCHTGAESCFFRVLDQETHTWRDGARALAFAERLEAVLIERKSSTDAKSYTRRLLDGGAALIGAKIREESDELARAIDHETDARVTSEAADVIYHAMVGLISRARSWRSVLAELARRFGTSGIDEKAARSEQGDAS
jgi:phosphoribosyl-ATP pyrophosphohydrolase/phosphoribosyl-AMP cyclohydrolase